MIVWIMLIFYVFVMFVYFIPTGSKLLFEKIDFQITKSNQTCTSDSNCNNNEKCFNNKCFPTYRSTKFCNPLTGSWVLEDINGVQYLKCTCRYPNIITQKFEGSNCDVDVACAPNGQLKSMFIQDISQAECFCKNGFKSTPYPQIGCKKLLPSEIKKNVCDPGEIHMREALNIYHTDYLNSIPVVKKCLKDPCSFNIFNGQPLKHTKFHPKYGCVCNPAYGNFGVKFDNTTNYLKTSGYDACGNIFKNEPNIETRVRLFTYFYINGDPPKSFIQFSGLRTDHLVDELQNFVKDTNLQIDEIWPYNYTQYIFENEYFIMHTRECHLSEFLNVENCYERVMREQQMIDCDKILDNIPHVFNRHIQAYALLYKYPVCKYTSTQYADLYKGWYVLNPHLLSFKEHRRLYRSNGIEIFYVPDEKWMVNLANSDFDKYESTSVYPNLKSLPQISSNIMSKDTNLRFL